LLQRRAFVAQFLQFYLGICLDGISSGRRLVAQILYILVQCVQIGTGFGRESILFVKK